MRSLMAIINAPSPILLPEEGHCQVSLHAAAAVAEWGVSDCAWAAGLQVGATQPRHRGRGIGPANIEFPEVTLVEDGDTVPRSVALRCHIRVRT